MLTASNPSEARRALELLYRATELDPHYALPAAMAAWGHARLVSQNASASPATDKAQAIRLSQRAGILDNDDPVVLTARLSVAYARIGESQAASRALDSFRRYAPDVTIADVTSTLFRPNFLERLAEGLDDLGLPPG